MDIWWKNFATGSLVNSGETITALLWCGPNLLSGDTCHVYYHRHEDRWSIINRPGAVIVQDPSPGTTIDPCEIIQPEGSGVNVTVGATSKRADIEHIDCT